MNQRTFKPKHHTIFLSRVFARRQDHAIRYRITEITQPERVINMNKEKAALR